MAELIIHRGTHQIGGCCTEMTWGGKRVPIDLELISPVPVKLRP